MQLHWLLPIVLITAKVFGTLARCWGLPAVVGEIVAGVALGPALIGVVASPGHGANDDPLFGLAQIGLCVLLFRVGLETELDDARRVAGLRRSWPGPACCCHWHSGRWARWR